MSLKEIEDAHEMPEVSALELTDRQRSILFDREVNGMSRPEISSNYKIQDDDDETLSVRGVESHLYLARKKRQYGINTLIYADQLNLWELLELDVPKPADIPFPDYATIPETVDHNETAFFDRQKTIAHLMNEYDGDNQSIVREMVDNETVKENAETYLLGWDEAGDERDLLQETLDNVLEVDDSDWSAYISELDTLSESEQEKMMNKLIKKIRRQTGVWTEEELRNCSLRELIANHTASKEEYDRLYGTVRQYKYYRIPDKLKKAYIAAIAPYKV